MTEAAKHTPGAHCVTVKGREYTVGVNSQGEVCSVLVHVKRDGICTAMRRLPLSSPIARAAIAAATVSHQ